MSLWDDAEGPLRHAPRRERAGGWLVLVVVIVLALLVGGGWYGAYRVAGDELPRGTTISGVEVGGRGPDGAVAALRAELEERVAQPIEVSFGGRTTRVDPARAGLSVDYEASVAAAGGGRSWRPGQLWGHFFGNTDLDAVVRVDEAALATVVAELEGQLGRPPRDGAVSFTRGTVDVRPPRRGRGLDPEAAREALVTAYLSGEEAELPVTTVVPAIEETDVQEALDTFANPATTAPVTLRLEGARVRLRPRDYLRTLSLRPRDGELVGSVDRRALSRLVDEKVGKAGAPTDARIELDGGEPQVVPSEAGTTYRPADLARALLQVVVRPEGRRRVQVEGRKERADFTTREAEKLRVTEQVSEFTTSYPHARYRNVNLGRAAELIDGTLLEPGETFSLNDTVGERTRANGFTSGTIISDGVYEEALGGGVSQMATTLFNAMFFAGLKDVEHQPHSFYIDRYPVGREATVVWGAVDLRFTNDTRYGVLIDAEITRSSPGSRGEVTVRMFSTKVWDIESRTSDRYAYTQPDTRVLTTPECIPNDGYAGFQVDVTRVFRRAGEQQVRRREKFHTVYTPSDTVVCQ